MDLSKMKSFIFSQLVCALLLTTQVASLAQQRTNQNRGVQERQQRQQRGPYRNSRRAEREEGVTIRGRIIQGTKLESFHIDLSELNVRFLKRVEVPQPPLPENWQKMKQAEREAWWKRFNEAPAGKRLAAEQQKILATAHEYEAKVEANGDFVAYDVLPGTYGMTARFDKEIGPRTYAFEVFGEVPVSGEAEVMSLGKKPLVITLIIRTGEPAATWRTIQTLDNQEVSLETFRGKYLLVNFWAADDPSKDYQKDVQEAIKKLQARHRIELLSIGLDEEKSTLVEFVRENKLKGYHVHAGRQDRIARVFGVHTTPGMLLIDPEGIIKMTYPEMTIAYRSGKPSLDVILDDRITGKDVPTEATKGSEQTDKKQ